MLEEGIALLGDVHVHTKECDVEVAIVCNFSIVNNVMLKVSSKAGRRCLLGCEWHTGAMIDRLLKTFLSATSFGCILQLWDRVTRKDSADCTYP